MSQKLRRALSSAPVALILVLAACTEEPGGGGIINPGLRDGGGGGMLTLDGGSTTGGKDDAGSTTSPQDDAGVVGEPDSGTANGCQSSESCNNGVDDDCDGRVDEDCACTVGETQSCYTGLPIHAGVGVCTFGTQTCTNLSDLGAWGPCEGDGRPQPVICGGGQDYRCTGIIDEGCGCPVGQTRECYSGPAGTAGVGICRAGSQSCVTTPSGGADWTPCAGEVLPITPNPCDGQDNTCTGMPFNGCDCTPGESRNCYEGPVGTENVGLCRGGSQSCQLVNGVPAWGACVGQVLPAPNTCDGVDRACNGNPNSGGCGCVLGTSRACYDGPAGTAGVGVCVGGVQSCEQVPGGGTVWGVCQGQVLPTPNTCDGIDRACTGNPLGGCTCTVGQTRGCYTGPANTRGIGACRDGSEQCVQAGAGSNWGGVCTGQVTPSTEVCGNFVDDDCNGAADEGCAPQITCPAPTSTPAGTAINLTASASSPNGAIVGWSWSVVNAPTGGIGTPDQWNPVGQNAQTEAFLPYIVGVYTLQVTATDVAGQQVSCQTTVTAVGHGLRVELTWDGAGDVDLHLHSPNTGVPWFTGDDCFYGNLAPIWDPFSPQALGANPSLDFDNVTANGPENTRIDTTPLNVPYTIGVHNYARAAGRVATVNVYCGGVTTPTATFFSRPLQGTSSGNSTSNDFWKVASVTFTSPTTCVVTTIDTYAASSVYNSSF
ncbi:hypothetical protein L6R52_21305 [Myxococcota bacterium]|nr:hypothetical protein [Myxococcota bacterium]